MQGKTALITGGSRGIGRAVALRLAGAGAYAVINYVRNDAAAEETLRLIRAAGGNGEIRRFDVSVFYETQKAVNGIVAARGRLDILVNNAGRTADGLIVRVQEEDWDRLIDTNLKGVFNCCRAVTRQMRKQRWGRIINIASVVAEAGNAGQSGLQRRQGRRSRSDEITRPGAGSAEHLRQRRLAGTYRYGNDCFPV